MIRAVFDGIVFEGEADQEAYDSDRLDFAVATGDGYSRDYDFCRVSVGVTFGFPRVRPEAGEAASAPERP